MDGISRAAGSPVHITFQGQDYRIRGLAAEDWGTVEQHMLSERPNPLHQANMAALETTRNAEQAAANMSPEARDVYLKQVQRVLDKMMDRALAEARNANTITAQEMLDYIESPRGVAFIFWLAFEKSYPQTFKLEQMYSIFAEMGEEARKNLADRLAAASGTDQLGNSTGPSSPTN